MATELCVQRASWLRCMYFSVLLIVSEASVMALVHLQFPITPEEPGQGLVLHGEMTAITVDGARFSYIHF